MAHFIIDGIDFGIDASKSSLTASDNALTLKIVGDESIVKNLMHEEENPWNWLICPPFLYIVELPIDSAENGDFDHKITEPDLDDYDIALYMMEHCDILPCQVTKKGKIVSIKGKVHAGKDPIYFHAEFEI